MNTRNNGSSRFSILRQSDESEVCPSLASLSTGQIALFNMFVTIVRYADMSHILNSINLSSIQGIVVIDEVELHLHTKLQKEILPSLIKLFPNVQFVITTHAPLFLLGMRECFGEDGFEVLELPSAQTISVEKFTEFQKAYDYLKESETFKEDLSNALSSLSNQVKPIIFTEGPTDWKHLKAAFSALKESGRFDDVLTDLDFEFFEYEASNSSIESPNKLQMGNTVLTQICEAFSKVPQNAIHIFISDRDNEQTNKKLGSGSNPFKSWGNNVYSFILPVPDHRKETPNICIEHYYCDEEIKTEWINPADGIGRRLYMGNEFDSRGLAVGIDRYCEKHSSCGNNSIAIIEGTCGDRVTSFANESNTNFALPKSIFAELILNKEPPFDSFNFDQFIKVFEIIKMIISEGASENA